MNMRVYDNKVLMYSSEDGIKATNYTYEQIQASEVPLKVAYIAEYNAVLPVATAKPEGDSLNLPGWILQVRMKGSDLDIVKVRIREILAANKFYFSEDDVNALAYIPGELFNDTERKYQEQLEEYAIDVATKNFISRNRYVDDLRYPHPNVSLYRETPSSTLAIKLPSTAQIIEHDLTEEYPSIGYRDLVEPFSGPMYALRGILQVLHAPTRDLKRKYLRECFEHAKVYGLKFTDTERERLINTFQEMPVEHLVGSEDNDNLPIQEFERPLYENLIAFINFHNERFIRRSNPTWGEDQIADEIQDWARQGKIYMGVSLYFHTLIKEISVRHLGFTGKFNDIQTQNEIEQEFFEKTKEGAENEDKDIMKLISGSGSQYGLNDGIFAYIESSAVEMGIEAWAEGIVKLTRFREFRPKHLVVGNNNMQVFDLVIGKVNTTSALDLTNFEVETDEAGGSMSVNYAVYNDFTTESGQVVSYPFTLVVAQYGHMNNSEELTSVSSTITLFDIVRSYKQGKPLLYEVELRDGKFINEIAPDETMEELLQAKAVGMRLAEYTSDELSEWAIDNRVPKLVGASWTALHLEELDLEQFEGIGTVAEALAETPPALKSSAVHSILGSIISKGAADYETDSVLELLNWYASEVYPIHEAEYEKLFNNKSPVNGANIEAVHLFTQPEGGDVVDETSAVSKTHDFNIMPAGDHKFIKLINKDGDKAYAYLAIIGKGQFLFAGLDEITPDQEKNVTDQFDKVAGILLKGIVGSKLLNSLTSTQYFLTEETPLKITKAIFS